MRTLCGTIFAAAVGVTSCTACARMAATGDYLLQPLKTAVNKHVLNQVSQDTVIRIARLGENAGVFGGCLMARLGGSRSCMRNPERIDAYLLKKAGVSSQTKAGL